MKAILLRLKSPWIFTFLSTCVALSLFLNSGFVSVSIIIFTFYCFFDRTPRPLDQAKSIGLLLLLSLYLCYALWAIFFADANGLNDLTKKIPLLIIPLGFLIRNKRIEQSDIEKILLLFTIGCIICSFICYATAISNVIREHSFSINTIDRKYYFFSNILLTEASGIPPIYLSMYFNLSFIYILECSLIKSRFLKAIIACYLALFLILIASKMGVITLLLLIILWFAFKIHNKRIFILMIVLAILTFSIGIYKLSFLKERFILSTQFDYTWTHGHLWNSTTHRLAIWACSVEAISRAPFFGYGTGNGQAALEQVYSEKKFVWGLQETYNPHNEFFSTQLDLGIIGSILFLGILCLWIPQAIRIKNIFFLSILLITSSSFLIESLLLRQKGIVFFSFFYSFFFMLNGRKTYEL